MKYFRRRGLWCAADVPSGEDRQRFPAVEDFFRDAAELVGNEYGFTFLQDGVFWRAKVLFDGECCNCFCEPIQRELLYMEPAGRIGGALNEHGMAAVVSVEDDCRILSSTKLLRRLFSVTDGDGLLRAMQWNARRYDVADMVRACVSDNVPYCVFELYRLQAQAVYCRMNLTPLLLDAGCPQCLLYVQTLDRDSFWQCHETPEDVSGFFTRVGLAHFNSTTRKLSAQNSAARQLLGFGFNARLLETSDSIWHACDSGTTSGQIELQFKDECESFQYIVFPGVKAEEYLMMLLPGSAEEESLPAFELLSDQEKHLALMAMSGASTVQLSQSLRVSLSTTKKTLTRLYKKMGVQGKLGLPAVIPEKYRTE